jgi:hypothetical protein
MDEYINGTMFVHDNRPEVPVERPHTCTSSQEIFRNIKKPKYFFKSYV